MNSRFSLLGRKEYPLTEKITVHIPLISELRESYDVEMGYYNLISNFIKTPCDAMVELDDMGIDYTKVKEYELFIMLFMSLIENRKKINQQYWNLVFPYLDINDLNVGMINDEYVVADKNNDIVINKNIYMSLADLLRQITFSEKNMEHYKVPEEETRRYIIDRARLKQKRALERQLKNGKKSSSALDGVILLLVNNCNFKYNFETVGQITLYDLYASLKQIYTDRDIDGIWSGYWNGNVDLKKIDNSKLNRIIL